MNERSKIQKKIEKTYFFEKYVWTFTIMVNVGFSDIDKILYNLHNVKAKREVSEKIYELFKERKENVGFTFSKNNGKKSILVIGNSSDKKSFFNTFSHEVAHLAIHIATEFGISLVGEEFCYLVGELSELMFDDISCFFCDCQISEL